MKISLITICFNSADTIVDTINSVLEQDYNNLEYIIIDGKSTDGTLDIVNSYTGKITKVISESDNGLYDAINKGIEAATGEIVGLIHADDILARKNAISLVANKFKTEQVEAVYSDLQYVDRKNTDIIVRQWISGNYKAGLFLQGWMPPHPTFYVKKAVYKKLGNYRLDFKSAADYELMLRYIHKNKISLAYIPETLVKMRVGGKSNVSLKNRIRANNEDRKAWKVNGLLPYFYTLYLKPLRKIGQYFLK